MRPTYTSPWTPLAGLGAFGAGRDVVWWISDVLCAACFDACCALLVCAHPERVHGLFTRGVHRPIYGCLLNKTGYVTGVGPAIAAYIVMCTREAGKLHMSLLIMA